MTDICGTYQLNMNLIYKGVNKDEAQKSVMDWEKPVFASTATIVLARTRIASCYGIWRREWPHQSITLNFLVAGLTNFAPVWCFGLVKQTFRRNAVSSLKCMEQVVEGSAVCNTAKLVGSESGETYVLVKNW
ncbi:hypothetical protein CAPTEDRAFT_198796 [Capitella teleta]|uniref:Uncharacterized protein n=1 Tax=Capitella teleta TaxID=283909 RepID=R7TQ63_CAPTE|nr:hypothetical protein CAPTEDRAFT_198796 [Capitella teleta]|eukprot:ELT93651.1 hypothetical protein CAPTEDRAFT_198796 [Capitella teleta]